MARVATLTCPACGHSGPADRRETAFDYIARDGLIELRRCRACRVPLLVRFTLFPTRATGEVIPGEVWEEMAVQLWSSPWHRPRKQTADRVADASQCADI
jgi:hypothetical protein